MFILCANKTQMAVRSREQLTSGSVNVYHCCFEFSPDWDGLTCVAVFRSGSQSVSVLLDDSGQCVIPWEVLTIHGRQLAAGVYGTRDGNTVLPTVWANLGVIQEGVHCCWTGSRPPAPGLYEQILAVLTGKQDKLRGQRGQVVGFDEDGNAVPQDAPTGGAADHSALSNRDVPDQHPITAITGLGPTLERIPRPMTAAELQNILYGGQENA